MTERPLKRPQKEHASVKKRCLDQDGRLYYKNNAMAMIELVQLVRSSSYGIRSPLQEIKWHC
jgi:hypothetical protein